MKSEGLVVDPNILSLSAFTLSDDPRHDQQQAMRNLKGFGQASQ
jgi:hypothetical protein